MHGIGEKIVYGAEGVRAIVAIRDEVVGGVKREYYVLREVGARNESETLVPTDSEILTDRMRPLLTREEVMNIIKTASIADALPWEAEGKIRSHKLREIMDSGNSALIIPVMRAILGYLYYKGEKTFYLAEESLLRRAENMIYLEFSEVLGIPREAVPEFIKENSGK